jgi:hypothetical protein
MLLNEVLLNVQGEQTMSSREIAELTGKRHDNVLRDCDVLNENYEKMGFLKIEEGYYTHPNTGNQQHREYRLTKMQTFDLITGYNTELRIKVNRRWAELEQMVSALSEKDRLLLNIMKSTSELELATNMNRYEVEYIQPLEIRAEKAEEMVEHKTQVISHLTDNIKLQTKRQFLNEIIRMKGNKNGLISDRWGLLYKFYEKQTKMNLSARLEAYNLVNKPKLSSKLELIDKVLNDMDILYAVAVKTFESDFKSKLQKYLDLL